MKAIGWCGVGGAMTDPRDAIAGDEAGRSGTEVVTDAVASTSLMR
jgi:hypothetical protein